jgi:hypothetical protein
MLRLLRCLITAIWKAALPVGLAFMAMGFAGVNPVLSGDGDLSFIWGLICIAAGNTAYQLDRILNGCFCKSSPEIQ